MTGKGVMGGGNEEKDGGPPPPSPSPLYGGPAGTEDMRRRLASCQASGPTGVDGSSSFYRSDSSGAADE